MSAVVWHDLECGTYGEDLELWLALAARERGPVLDVGAGTGRVALRLAADGHEVVAVDRDAALLEAVRERAGDRLTVTTVAADARELALGRRFGLVVVAMQTIQLLGGAAGRARFLERVREHLVSGGLLACALADALEAFDAEHQEPPRPDVRELDGVVYSSRPVAVRDLGDRAAIERMREVVALDGALSSSFDVVEIDRLDAATLEREAAAHGLRAEPAAEIPASDEYVGSTVVMLRG